MIKFSTALFTLALCFSSSINAQWSSELATVPERSNYQETSTHADVMSFIRAVADKAEFMHLADRKSVV